MTSECTECRACRPPANTTLTCVGADQHRPRGMANESTSNRELSRLRPMVCLTAAPPTGLLGGSAAHQT